MFACPSEFLYSVGGNDRTNIIHMCFNRSGKIYSHYKTTLARTTVSCMFSGKVNTEIKIRNHST